MLPTSNQLPESQEKATAEFSDEEEVVDDDEGEGLVESTKPRTNGKKKVKAKKKTKAQLQQERAEQLRVEEEAAKKAKAMTEEEKMAEKLRLQKLVEESDNKLTDELFNVKREQGIFDEDTVAATLQTIPLDSEEHFKNFASAIAKRLELEVSAIDLEEFAPDCPRSVVNVFGMESYRTRSCKRGSLSRSSFAALLRRSRMKILRRSITC